MAGRYTTVGPHLRAGRYTTKAEQVAGTVSLCLTVYQVLQLDKSKDCVAVLCMLGAEAEQVAGTVLLCLAVLGCLAVQG